jgi:hypothetical protein
VFANGCPFIAEPEGEDPDDRTEDPDLEEFPVCEPDYNGDGLVNERDLRDKEDDVNGDLRIWINECWRPCSSDCGDYNGDGVTDRADLRAKKRDVQEAIDIWREECWRPAMPVPERPENPCGFDGCWDRPCDECGRPDPDAVPPENPTPCNDGGCRPESEIVVPQIPLPCGEWQPEIVVPEIEIPEISVSVNVNAWWNAGIGIFGSLWSENSDTGGFGMCGSLWGFGNCNTGGFGANGSIWGGHHGGGTFNLSGLFSIGANSCGGCSP